MPVATLSPVAKTTDSTPLVPDATVSHVETDLNVLPDETTDPTDVISGNNITKC